MSVEDVIGKVREYPHRHVVITGGEPFTQSFLTLLVEELLKEGFSVQIETNGTLWQKGMDTLASHIHITLSPKGVASWFVHPKVLLYARELKWVVDHLLTLDIILMPSFRRFLEEERVVLQPEGNKEIFLQKALSLQEELLSLGYRVRVLPQLHKLLGLK